MKEEVLEADASSSAQPRAHGPPNHHEVRDIVSEQAPRTSSANSATVREGQKKRTLTTRGTKASANGPRCQPSS